MKREKPLIKRLIPLLVILAVVIVALAVVPTIARYIRGAEDVKNGLESIGSKTPTVVNGELKNGKMQDVKINVGDTRKDPKDSNDFGYPVYVRVKVLITWKSESGNVLYLDPEASYTDDEGEFVEKDYEVTYGADWTKIGDYYYYLGSNDDSLNGVVKSNGLTTALITSLEDNKTKLPYDGYDLNVEIIVQTVQAVGYTDDDFLTACEDAWNLPSGTLKDALGNGSDNEQEPDDNP